VGAAAAAAGRSGDGGAAGGAAWGVVPTLSTVERRGAMAFAASLSTPSALGLAPVGAVAAAAFAAAEVRPAVPAVDRFYK
jgi:hypothetical protein